MKHVTHKRLGVLTARGVDDEANHCREARGEGLRDHGAGCRPREDFDLIYE